MRLVPVAQQVGQKAYRHRGSPHNGPNVEKRRSNQLLKGRETDTDKGHSARDAEEAGARIKDGDVWGEAFVFVGAGHGGVLLVQLRDAAGAAIREHVDDKKWWRRRRRRYRCLEGGANHGGSGLHGGADLRWAENTTHGALE